MAGERNVDTGGLCAGAANSEATAAGLTNGTPGGSMSTQPSAAGVAAVNAALTGARPGSRLGSPAKPPTWAQVRPPTPGPTAKARTSSPRRRCESGGPGGRHPHTLGDRSLDHPSSCRRRSRHAEDIRWTAERLAQADDLAGQQLQAKAAELEGIRFDGEGDTSGDPTIRMVDHDVKLNPPVEPDDDQWLPHPDHPGRSRNGKYNKDNSRSLPAAGEVTFWCATQPSRFPARARRCGTRRHNHDTPTGCKIVV